MSKTETTPTAPPVTLTARAKESGEAEATIPVRWCVRSDLTTLLREKKIVNAHVLISIVRNGRERQRYLAPLHAEMTWVRFSGVGSHEIHATVVWHSDDDPREMRNWFLSRSHGEYIHGTMNYEGSQFLEPIYFNFGPIQRLDGEDVLSVVVAEDMFAKPPPRWLQTYQGFFWQKSGVDQCSTRRRTIASFFLLPFFLLAQVARTIFLVVLLGGSAFAGLRNIRYRVFWHPFQSPFDALGEGGHFSRWFFCDAQGSDIRDKKVWMMVVNPPVLLILTIFGSVFTNWWGIPWVLAPLLGFVIMGGFFGIVFGIAYLFPNIQNWLEDLAQSRSRNWLEKEKVEAAKRMADLDAMVCNGYRDPNIAALLPQNRTVKLRYQALKSKVCRPYAK